MQEPIYLLQGQPWLHFIVDDILHKAQPRAVISLGPQASYRPPGVDCGMVIYPCVCQVTGGYCWVLSEEVAQCRKRTLELPVLVPAHLFAVWFWAHYFISLSSSWPITQEVALCSLHQETVRIKMWDNVCWKCFVNCIYMSGILLIATMVASWLL